VVLQSGERSDPEFVDMVEEILLRIRELPVELGITLSCGEETLETYRRWRRAGATRYLLRIESSNETLFRAIHPADAVYSERKAALQRLRDADFQTGSGVMIGLPGQTAGDLAADVDFFRQMDLDMIGMGPFLPQEDTPLGQQFPDAPGDAQRRLELSLLMIAVTRLVLRDVNIAATTALQAIDPAKGRERGILAGANVIMPNVGDVSRRKDYQLYNGKPSLDENSSVIREKLTASLAEIGEKPRFNEPGDPLHYHKRKHL
jgi:biotin synthase